MLHGLTLDLAPILAQAGALGWVSSVYSAALLIIGFSLVIFVHELGHFLAAKWAKVRVERFAIGFGRPILAYRKGIGLRFGSTQPEFERRVAQLPGRGSPPRQTAGADDKEEGDSSQSNMDRTRLAEELGIGETEYCFNILPLGGYVKMMGQEDFVVDKSGELKVKDDPDSFTNKSIGRRMVIISAGVVMNLLFAAIAFAIVVMVGRYQPPSIIGIVAENTPAERAGLQTGDRITAINGREIQSFGDLMASVMLSDPGETLELTVMRNGRIVEPPPRVLPEFKKDEEVRQLGIGPAMNRRVLQPSPVLNEERLPDELQKHDELVGLVVDGRTEELKGLGPLYRSLIAARGAPVEAVVKRPVAPETLTDEMCLKPDPQIETTRHRVQLRALWLPLAYERGDSPTGSLLGLVPRLTVLLPHANKSFAAAGALSGDVIVKIGPHSYPSLKEVKELIQAGDDQEVPISVRRTRTANHGLDARTVEFCAINREALIGAALENPQRALESAAELAASAGLPDAEQELLLTALQAAGDGPGWRRWLENVDVHTLKPIIPSRPFSLLGLLGITDKPAPKVDAVLAGVDEDHLVVAYVLDKLANRVSPANAAGIPRGAVILEADGQPVRRWYQLSNIFRAAAGRTIPITFRVEDQIRRTEMTIPNCVSAALDLPAGGRIITIGGETKHALVVGGVGKDDATEDKTELISLPDWRVTEALLKESIGRTVDIEFVTSGNDRHTAAYAVTADNVDPWLHRVRFAPSFGCYSLRERHVVRNPIKAVGIGFRQAYDATMQTIQSIRHMLFTRTVGMSKVSGPVGIIRMGSKIADSGLLNLLWFLAVISANLAVINFLPLPIVDGGLFLFLLMEKVRGEPVSIKTQIATQVLGIALIATVFILITYQDIKNWILGA